MVTISEDTSDPPCSWITGVRDDMADHQRIIAIVGGLGVYPMVRLSLAGRRILAYLSLRGQPVTRNVASADLWPDVAEKVGRANLRRALWQLPGGWVVAVGPELVLHAVTDIAKAHHAAAGALRGDPLTFDDITLLSKDLLPGWHEEWVLPAQEAFHLLRLQALEAACRTLSAAGRHALATQAGAAAVAADPLCESAVEALIDAHLAQRNRHQAAQCFRSLAERLREELGVSPDPALTQRLVQIGLARRSPR